MKNNIQQTITIVLLVYAILLGVSLCLEPNESHLSFRSLRVLVSFTLIPILLFKAISENNYIFGFCLFYSISSFFAIGFENNLVGIISMVANAISFVFLSKMIFEKIERKPMSKTFLISLILVILINIWLLYLFMDVIATYLQTTALFISVCMSIVSSFTLSVLAFIYNNEANSKHSLLLVFFIIFLVFSETFRGAGYYSFVDPVYGQYVARSLLIVSFILLLLYASLETKKDRL